MTRDEILNMPAGRELDVLVAEKVMGKKQKHLEPQWEEGNTPDGQDGWCGFYCPRCHCPEDLYKKQPCCSHYSTSIAAAWGVVERMAHEPYCFQVENINIIGATIKWRAVYWGEDMDIQVVADTAELAICRAALLAVMK